MRRTGLVLLIPLLLPVAALAQPAWPHLPLSAPPGFGERLPPTDRASGRAEASVLPQGLPAAATVPAWSDDMLARRSATGPAPDHAARLAARPTAPTNARRPHRVVRRDLPPRTAAPWSAPGTRAPPVPVPQLPREESWLPVGSYAPAARPFFDAHRAREGEWQMHGAGWSH